MNWDLTTRKRMSRKYHIIKCPKCGRYGRVSFYIGKSKTEKMAGSVVHKGHIVMDMFNEIDDSCTLNKEQAQSAKAILEK